MTKRIPLPAGGVRIETFIPWTLIKRGVLREVITPIKALAAFREEAQRETQQQELEQHSSLLRALGLAHYWLKLLDDGTLRSITEIAAAEGMDVGRVSRIMRLAQMAPAMVEVCLAESANAPATGKRMRSATSLDWSLQRL